MSPRRTLAAAAVFAVLLGLAIVDSLRREIGDLQSAAERTLVEMSLEEVQSFTLTNRHGAFSLERRGDGWWLIEPIEAMADQGFCFAILHNVTNAKRQGQVEGIPGAQLADYGLDSPAISATFRAADREATLDVGARAPGMPQFFATVRGSGEVFTVTEHIAANLTKTLFQLRDKRLFPNLPEPLLVTAITVTAEAAATRIIADGDREWWVEGPPRRRADATVATDLISTLPRLEASSMPENVTPAAAGLNPPYIELAVETQNAGTLRLDLGLPTSARGDEFYAQRPGIGAVVAIRAQDSSRIPRRGADWLDRDLLHLSPGEVGAFSLTLPWADLNVSFERTESSPWTAAGNAGERVDQEAVQELLDLMARLTADGVVTTRLTSLEAYGLDRPAFTFVWHSHDRSVTERLDNGGNLGDTQAHVRRNAEPVIYAAPNVYGDVIALRQRLIDRHLITASLASAERLDYRYAELSGSVQRVQGIWVQIGASGEPGAPVNAQIIENVFSTLALATYDRALSGEQAMAVRRTLADPPWRVAAYDAAGNLLGEIRSTIPSHGDTTAPLFAMTGDDRAVVISDRAVLIAVQNGLRPLELHQMGVNLGGILGRQASP